MLLATGLAAILMVPVGCGGGAQTTNNAAETVRYLPVQNERQTQLLTALLSGKLVLDHGYLRVSVEPQAYLIIWPYGYSWQVKNNEIWVLDDKGQAIVKVGDSVTVGGGNMPQSFAEQKIGKTLPENVQGPFWLANPGMKATN